MTAAFAIRDEMNDIDEAPGKVWFWELERAVIDAGRCVQCGVCVAACPSDSLGIGADDLPKLVKMCTGCSLCWDFCPRGGLRYEALGEVMAGLQTDEQWTLNGPRPQRCRTGRGGTAAADSVIPRDEESRPADENGLWQRRDSSLALRMTRSRDIGMTPSPIRTATGMVTGAATISGGAGALHGARAARRSRACRTAAWSRRC